MPYIHFISFINLQNQQLHEIQNIKMELQIITFNNQTTHLAQYMLR